MNCLEHSICISLLSSPFFACLECSSGIIEMNSYDITLPYFSFPLIEKLRSDFITTLLSYSLLKCRQFRTFFKFCCNKCSHEMSKTITKHSIKIAKVFFFNFLYWKSYFILLSNAENSELSSSFGATDTVMNSFTVQNNHLVKIDFKFFRNFLYVHL